ncbi:hypothetical protein D3C81_1835550 [compost metagenome]
MLGGIVNPADKSDRVVNRHNFALHAAKKVGPHAEQPRAWVVIAENHARGGEFADKLLAEIR